MNKTIKRMAMGVDKIYFVLPGTGKDYQGGGLNVGLTLSEMLSKQYDVEVVLYKQNDSVHRSLDEAMDEASKNSIFIITWGPDIELLAKKLDGKNVVYFAQSVGWNTNIPSNIPIISVSRYVMSYWASKNPFNPMFVLSPIVDVPSETNSIKDIDVLFIERKSSIYLKGYLVPELRKNFNVHTVSDFVSRNDLLALLKRSKVYIYSSREHGHSGHNWIEGFGLQPLEAFLCGCSVFSNLHGGLSDHMDPSINMQQLEVFSLGYDLHRISNAIKNNNNRKCDTLEQITLHYSETNFETRLNSIMHEIVDFFDFQHTSQYNDIKLTDVKVPSRRANLWKSSLKNKLKKL
ncbi:glycosyltransferase [Vibrio sp. 2175-1]|uniref:glycosyltransferase n=1 Tax=Vibrio TaxID=662 RepID=UPI001CDC7A59|nr:MULTISPECIES: glycosyltransferase [Vibrio]MCA2494221.1 glycosyltransferase [Vibrio alginolyticus]MDW2221091.1 glycosyltransferase [Vibrio sp. 2175-1]